MSVALEYPNKCAKCGLLMAAGTSVDFFKEGRNYVYIHAEDCAEAKAAAAAPTRFRPEFDLRECSRLACHYATGASFRKHCAPPCCPLCSSPWLVEDLVA